MWASPWTDMMTNEEVLNKADAKRLMIKTMRERKLRYFGHLISWYTITSGNELGLTTQMQWKEDRIDRDHRWKATVSSNATGHGT